MQYRESDKKIKTFLYVFLHTTEVKNKLPCQTLSSQTNSIFLVTLGSPTTPKSFMTQLKRVIYLQFRLQINKCQQGKK